MSAHIHPATQQKESCKDTFMSFHRTDASEAFGMSVCRKPMSSTLAQSEHAPWKNEGYSAEPGHYITFSKTVIHPSICLSRFQQ